MADFVRVAVVDPYPIFREGVVQTIARAEGLTLAGEGSTIADARRLARESGADILILDISMPEGGIEAVKSIFRHSSHCKLLVLTALDDALRVSQAIAAGARGYVLKGVTGQELVAAIKLVYEGRPYVTAELAARLLVNAHSGPLQPARNLQLSYRERQILDNMCKGLTNREIAAALQLTDGTIKHYLTALFKKLDVRNRMQAIQVKELADKLSYWPAVCAPLPPVLRSLGLHLGPAVRSSLERVLGPNPAMSYKTFHARALQLAERIDLKGLDRSDQFSSNPLAFKGASGGTVTLFRFGAAVFRRGSAALPTARFGSDGCKCGTWRTAKAAGVVWPVGSLVPSAIEMRP